MKTIVMGLDPASIDSAIKELEEFARDLPSKNEEFLRRLARKGNDVAATLFQYGNQNPIPGNVKMTYYAVDDHTWVIEASGTQVCFLEFGTGVYADSGHKYASQMPFEVRPGSWSDEHGKTYQDWLNNKDPNKGEYRYNGYPVRALLSAYNYMKDSAEALANEVFGR